MKHSPRATLKARRSNSPLVARLELDEYLGPRRFLRGRRPTRHGPDLAVMSEQAVRHFHASKETPVKELLEKEEQLDLMLQVSATKIDEYQLERDFKKRKFNADDDHYEKTDKMYDDQLAALKEEEQYIKKQKKANDDARRETAKTFEESDEVIKEKIKNEQENFMTFRLAYEDMQNKRLAEELEQLDIKKFGRDYKWKRRVEQSIGDIDLDDVDLDDLRSKVELSTWSEANALGTKALIWLLGLLNKNGLGKHPSIPSKWIGKDNNIDWKITHGVYPGIKVRNATKDRCVQRVVTYLELIDDRTA